MGSGCFVDTNILVKKYYFLLFFLISEIKIYAHDPKKKTWEFSSTSENIKNKNHFVLLLTVVEIFLYIHPIGRLLEF